MNGGRRVKYRLNEWDGELEQRASLALEEARALEERLLVSTDLEVLASAIVDEVGPQPLQLLVNEMWNDRRESTAAPDSPAGTDLPLLHLEFHAPVVGAARLLDGKGLYYQSGTYQRTPGQQGWRVSLSIDLEDGDGVDWSQVEKDLQRGVTKWREALLGAIEEANADVAAQRDRSRAEVQAVLQRRRERLLAVHAGILAADIALWPTAELTAIPLTPKNLTLETVERLADSGAAEHRLAIEIADSLIGTINAFGKALERLPQTANRLLGEDEEGLRDVLLFLLNANWSGLATGETFIGVGKSDILLRWRDKDAFIAECKIWRGAQGLADGVDQLLRRYTVWRDTRVALVLFVRDRQDISAAIAAAYATLEGHARTLRSAPSAGQVGDPRDYVMSSIADQQRAITLTLLPVVLAAAS